MSSSSTSGLNPSQSPTTFFTASTSRNHTDTNPSTTSVSTSLATPYANGTDSGFFDTLGSGHKAGMGIGITIGVILVVALSVWFCCGCCGLRAKRNRQRAHPGRQNTPVVTQHPVPLRMISTSEATRPTELDAPPPRYEEVVPPQHQHTSGGVRHAAELEEGIISDGKTPLSEIPYEDVALHELPSAGSSRNFGNRHHELGGDTRGHTNT